MLPSDEGNLPTQKIKPLEMRQPREAGGGGRPASKQSNICIDTRSVILLKISVKISLKKLEELCKNVENTRNVKKILKCNVSKILLKFFVTFSGARDQSSRTPEKVTQRKAFVYYLDLALEPLRIVNVGNHYLYQFIALFQTGLLLFDI